MSIRFWIALFVAIVALLQYRLWVSEDGLREVWRIRTAHAAQAAENAELVRRNDVLEAEVSDLREGLDAIEEQARTDLGMIGESEAFYQTVEPRDTAHPAEAW